MTTPTDAAPEPAPTGLIVFGRAEGGKPHASRFSPADAELAEKAAGIMGLQALRIVSAEDHALAAELPAGRVFGSGKAFVPFVAQKLFARLEAAGGAFRPEPPADPAPGPGRAKGGRRAAGAGDPANSASDAAGEPAGGPADWGAITLGSAVLASEGEAEGWFEAVVVAERPHDLFELRWRDWPDSPHIVRRRDHLALLPPGLATQTEVAS